MVEVRFAPWWKHPEIVLEEREDPDWGDRPFPCPSSKIDQDGRPTMGWVNPRLVLVGRGTPEFVDVFAGEPLQLPNPRERAGKESRRSWRIRLSHALAFASIETPEQALLFAQRYGLLGLHRKPPVSPAPAAREALLKALERGASPDEAFLEYSHVMEEAEKPPEIPPERVYEWLSEASELRRELESVLAEWDTDRDEALKFATGWLDLKVAWDLNDPPRLRLAGGRPVLEYNKLLSALLTQAVMDLTNVERPPVRCAGPGCGLWFFPTHPSALYCSEECRRSAQNARLYRKRVKEAKGGDQEPERPR